MGNRMLASCPKIRTLSTICWQLRHVLLHSARSMRKNRNFLCGKDLSRMFSVCFCVFRMPNYLTSNDNEIWRHTVIISACQPFEHNIVHCIIVRGIALWMCVCTWIVYMCTLHRTQNWTITKKSEFKNIENTTTSCQSSTFYSLETNRSVLHNGCFIRSFPGNLFLFRFSHLPHETYTNF